MFSYNYTHLHLAIECVHSGNIVATHRDAHVATCLICAEDSPDVVAGMLVC